MSQDNDKSEEYTRNVVEGAEEVGERDDIVTLSSGVQLKVKEVPKHFIFTVTSKFEKPKVPWADIGGMQKENPNDPDYLADLERWVADTANAGNDIALLLGTELVEVPNDVMKHGSKEFKEMMEYFELPMLKNKNAIYLNWIKAIAAPTDADITLLLGEIGRLTGVAEADVAQAVDRFRSIAVRDPDSES